MAEPDGGYVLIYRKLLDHPAFRSPAEALAFAYLIAKAAWRPTRVKYRRRAMTLERGQLTISTRDFAEAMERPRMWAHRLLARLEEAKMIAVKVGQSRDSRGTVGGTVPKIISICNYDEYQTQQVRVGTVVDTLGGTLGGTQNNKGKKEYIGKSMSLPLETSGKVREENNLFSREEIETKDRRKRPWKEGEELPVEWLRWAQGEKGWLKEEVLAEAARFIDGALAHRRAYVDWFAAWRNWVRSPYCSTPERPKQGLYQRFGG